MAGKHGHRPTEYQEIMGIARQDSMGFARQDSMGIARQDSMGIAPSGNRRYLKST